MTTYALKPRFQDLLRPWVALLPALGVTANQVTVVSALGSISCGAVMVRFADSRAVFVLMPIWLLARMALNAADGMLAREFRQKSALGGYLNELGDVVSDAALYAPFAFVEPFGPTGIGVLILLSMMTELAGTIGSTVGASRRYEGPMGKSDRAVVFGALGLWIGCSGPTPAWLGWSVPLLTGLLILTVVNRVRAGIGEAERAGSPRCC